jgi:uncharacterized protein (TIGR02271 family)
MDQRRDCEHGNIGTEVSVPVVEEQVEVGSRQIVTGRIVISKKVEEHEEVVNAPCFSEQYRVERIPMNLAVDNPPPVRCMGETTIIPVIEEVAVVKKQLVLREELRITRIRTELSRSERVRLKRARVDVVKVPNQQRDSGEIDSSGAVLMAKTIVALFDDQQKAQKVMRDLMDIGYPQNDMHCIAPTGASDNDGDLISRLTMAGVPNEEARHYCSGLRSGKSVLVVKTSDSAVETAMAMLERNGATDLDQRRGAATVGIIADNTTDFARPGNDSQETVIPVVKEDLKVGKRQVQGQGFRIYTHMTEQPIEQPVSLRREHVDIERRPADRPASQEEMRGFKESTIEMTETTEEPVVSKDARVVEEVVVSKGVSQEERMVRDTIRRTEVNVEKTDGQIVSDGQNSNIIDGRPATEMAGENVSRVNEEPAYNYGRTLASDPRYQGKDWSTIEPEARREWTRHNRGAWEEFKDSIRRTWERMSGK